MSRAVLVLGALLGAAPAAAQDGTRVEPWPEAVVELFESLPVQDGGRVKPLATFASFTLLRLSGRRTLDAEPGGEPERLTASEWLLDALFFPVQAEEYPLLLVEHPAAIDALGIVHGRKEARDRYSLAELRAGLPRLFELAQAYSAVEEAEQSAVQRQITRLASNVSAYLAISRTEALAIAPPVEPGEELWSTPADILGRGLREEAVPVAHRNVLASLRAMGVATDDLVAFEGELRELRDTVVGLARERGEYRHVPLERAYYRWKPLTWSLASFLLAFLVAAVGWMRPSSRWLPRATLALVTAGALLACAAIAARCVIRGRPPVSTLYETVLFVTAVGVLLAVGIEVVDRRRVAASAAAFFGAVGLFVANGYETLDARDTMPSLVAVLDTNFWLATHVTTITIGYSAGMLAALFGSLYLVLEWLPRRSTDLRRLARTVYGVVCFALIFSVIGTVLGGIWANDSWGRFWGWDPKENGALLIVLSQIAILHARRGGFLRDRGLCMAAAFGGTVVAFSWWGVNLLGVGLHSYGFTSGIHGALWTYYLVQWSVVAAGTVRAWTTRGAADTGRRPADASRVRPPVEPPAVRRAG